MAEEPQPTNPGPVPSAAEKQREEAALSNLSSQQMSADDAEGGPSTGTDTDTAALGAAVSNLAISGQDERKPGAGGKAVDGKGAGASGTPNEEVVKKVKLDPGDVAFLVQELEVSKKKAGEMLQASGGDMGSAIRAFISPVRV